MKPKDPNSAVYASGTGLHPWLLEDELYLVLRTSFRRFWYERPNTRFLDMWLPGNRHRQHLTISALSIVEPAFVLPNAQFVVKTNS
ncbi:hypothetical protein CC2G_011284 [Coprinopsis cinerea AmutBmut pab1-1]|nr:hypothetical protein CC2G_011284 [Coprinopsis cinerea AmutBmut pab1-1]